MYRKLESDSWGKKIPNGLSRRSFLSAGTAVAAASVLPPAGLAQPARGPDGAIRFMRVPTQYIAALGAPDATSGAHAEQWGLWRLDPGPRGVSLDRYQQLKAAGGAAPSGWQFDDSAWWLEEHGLIMEAPEFPLPVGRYMVTGNRATKSVLTVDTPGRDDSQRWTLSDDATIYDVTHLRCRSALYTRAGGSETCSPAAAPRRAFPVAPGAEMPPVGNCNKQDYAVLIVIGMAVEDV